MSTPRRNSHVSFANENSKSSDIKELKRYEEAFPYIESSRGRDRCQRRLRPFHPLNPHTRYSCICLRLGRSFSYSIPNRPPPFPIQLPLLRGNLLPLSLHSLLPLHYVHTYFADPRENIFPFITPPTNVQGLGLRSRKYRLSYSFEGAENRYGRLLRAR